MRVTWFETRCVVVPSDVGAGDARVGDGAARVVLRPVPCNEPSAPAYVRFIVETVLREAEP